MMRFGRNKKNPTNNDNSKTITEKEIQTNSLKQEMIDSLLKTRTDSHTLSQPQIKEIDNLGKEFDTDSQIDNKISLLIKKLTETSQKTAIPKIDFTTGNVSYPILAEIGENKENLKLLERLTESPYELLEKFSYEKLVVCPKHQNSFAINVRLHCSKCNSMNIEKLHLLEHNKCGYIAERKKYIVSEQNITTCPSCNKKIEDDSKELRIPAMWYTCNGCKEKFDDVSIRLYCREFDHDFSPNQSQTIEVQGYKLKKENSNPVVDISAVFEKLNKIFSNLEFVVEENVSLKGKSGRYHHIDLFAKDKSNKSVCIFIKKSNEEIDNSEINSKIIEVLDTEPSIAILIGFASISDKGKSIAASYNVSIISSQDTDEIVASTKKLLSAQLGKFRENVPKP